MKIVITQLEAKNAWIELNSSLFNNDISPIQLQIEKEVENSGLIGYNAGIMPLQAVSNIGTAIKPHDK